MGHAAATDGGEPAIAFAGGGAGAALAAIALLRVTTWLRLNYRILLFDEHGRFARGRAFGGAGSACLLQLPVKHMSALPDRPCHLMEWARAEQRSGRRADLGGAAPPTALGGATGAGAPPLAPSACGPETLLSRGVYGDYLFDTLAATAAWAAPYARLHARAARVVAVSADSSGAAVRLDTGERVAAAAAVVATGDPALADPPSIAGAADASDGANGLATCRCGALTHATGGPADRLFAVGAVCGGGSDATVPGIRGHAEALAQRIADTVLRTPPRQR